MVEVCIVCGKTDVIGKCDKCGANCCDRHFKETGKGEYCPECFEEIMD